MSKPARNAPPRPVVAPGQVVIAPSILSADFSRLADELRALAKAGLPWVHLDVMDNHFVPNLTFGPPVIAALRKVDPTLYFDAHLMVDVPMSLVDPLVNAGVQNITVHAESLGAGLPDAIATLRHVGVHAGVVIKPDTPLDAIAPVLPNVDLVLIMTVEPGFGGQAMIPSCLNKVRDLRRRRDASGHKYLIQIDGGVSRETAHLAAAAGAEVFVAGSAVFKGGKIAENVKAILDDARRAHG